MEPPTTIAPEENRHMRGMVGSASVRHRHDAALPREVGEPLRASERATYV